MPKKPQLLLLSLLFLLSCTKTQNSKLGLFQLGLEKYQAKDFFNAEFLFTKALLSNPTDEKCLIMRGKTRFFLKRFLMAEKDFKQVIKNNPNNITSQIWLARLNILQKKDLEITKENLLKLNANDDENVSVFILLGQLSQIKGEMVEATKYYELALHHEAEYKIIHQKLAEFYKSLGLPNRALKYQKK